jgi:CRP/FNR family transcriptional regulator
LHDFDRISLSGIYPQGARLFAEGQSPKGVFILCGGRAKLSIGSSNGKSLIRVAEQGEILGVSATLTGDVYDETAEMLESGQVNFIRRDHFLSLLTTQADASLLVAKQLGRSYAALNEQARVLALSGSVGEKLARLLLSWLGKSGRRTEDGVRLKLSFTHGEIAQMIGVTRETVTRLLGELRADGVIQLKGADLIVKDQAALDAMVNS